MTESVRNESLAVGTSAVLVDDSRLKGVRRTVVLVNTSTAGQIIYLTWGRTATTTGGGVVLYPQGSWGEAVDSVFIPNEQEIWAIASAVSGTLAIHERLDDSKAMRD